MTAADDEARALAAAIPVSFSRLKRRLREQGAAAELTPSQLSVLGQLERLGSSTVTELARAEGVRPQSMGATIAALDAAGFITGEPDVRDGRRTILSLSPATVEKFSASRATSAGWLLAAIDQKLSPQERRVLAEGLSLLDKLTEP